MGMITEVNTILNHPTRYDTRAVRHSRIYGLLRSPYYGSRNCTVRAAGIKMYSCICTAYIRVSSDSIISANGHSSGLVISKTNTLQHKTAHLNSSPAHQTVHITCIAVIWYEYGGNL